MYYLRKYYRLHKVKLKVTKGSLDGEQKYSPDEYLDLIKKA